MGMDVTTLCELYRSVTTIAALLLGEKLQALARQPVRRRAVQKVNPSDF
jgi:hypothetical protein